MQIDRINYVVKYPKNTVAFLESVNGPGKAFITETVRTLNKNYVGFDSLNWIKINKDDIVNYASQGYDIWYMVGRGEPAEIYRSKIRQSTPTQSPIQSVMTPRASSITPVIGLQQPINDVPRTRSVGCVNDVNNVISRVPKLPLQSVDKIHDNIRKMRSTNTSDAIDLSLEKVRLINRMLDMIEDI